MNACTPTQLSLLGESTYRGPLVNVDPNTLKTHCLRTRNAEPINLPFAEVTKAVEEISHGRGVPTHPARLCGCGCGFPFARVVRRGRKSFTSCKACQSGPMSPAHPDLR